MTSKKEETPPKQKQTCPRACSRERGCKYYLVLFSLFAYSGCGATVVLFIENKSHELLSLSFGVLPAVRTKCVKSTARAFMSDERKLKTENIQLFSFKRGNKCVQENKNGTAQLWEMNL